MDGEDLKAEARRESELAELTVVGARERVHEAEHAVAARDLLAAFERLVEGRIGSIADEIRREIGTAVAAEIERIHKDLQQARGAIEADVAAQLDGLRAGADRAASDAARAAQQRAQAAAEEITAAEKRASETISGQAREVKDRAQTIVTDLSESLAGDAERAHALIEERLNAALEDRLKGAIEDLASRTHKLRSEIESGLNERVDERVAARVRTELEQETRRQRSRREERLAEKLEKRMQSEVERRSSESAKKIAEDQERRESRTMDALSRSIRDELDTRLRALEERAERKPGWQR